MRTTFVNPRRRARRRKPAARRAAPVRRRRRKAVRSVVRRRRPAARRAAPRRRRRRNAGITSFVGNPAPKRRRKARRRNPLILSNPRRRAKRRNPGLTGVNPMTASGRSRIFKTVLESAGGAALAYAVNQFGTRNIAGDWTRRSVQVGIAVLGSAIISKGMGRGSSNMGAAFAGAMMYPLIADLSLMLGVTGAADYGLGADLGVDMDAQLGDMEEFYLDGDPTSAGLELW